MEIPTTVTNQKLLLFAISIASFMTAVDCSIVNVALPTIAASFNVSTGLVSWVSTIYLLVLTCCLMIFGKLADRIGFRRIFLGGFLLFSLGSLFCALSPSLFLLVGSRALQGVGGAMLVGINTAMVTTFIPSASRAKAIGFVVAMSSLGITIGPFLGGMLTGMISWHWIFLVTVPVGIFACIISSFVVPFISPRENSAAFDTWGALYLFMVLASLIYGLNMGVSLGFTSPLILTAFGLCIAGAVLFVRQECTAPDPLLDMQLYRKRDFLFTNIGIILMMSAYFGSSFLLPFFFEYVQGMPTSISGVYLTVPSVTLMIAGYTSGTLYGRFGPRKLCMVASALYILAFLLFSTFGMETSNVVIITALAFFGFGLGLYFSSNTSEIMCLAPREKQGMVSSLISTERNAGATVGIVVFELLFIHALMILNSREGLGLTEGVLISQPKLVGPLLASAFDFAFSVGAVVAVLAFILAVFTPNPVKAVDGEDDEFCMTAE